MHTLMKGDVFVFVFVVFFSIAQLPLLLLLVVAGNQKHVWPTAGMRHSFIVVTVDGRRAPPAIIFINFSQKGIYVAKRTGHSAQL